MRGVQCPMCSGKTFLEHDVAIVEGGYTKVPIGSFCIPCHVCNGTGIVYVADALDGIMQGNLPPNTEYRGSRGGYRPSEN